LATALVSGAGSGSRVISRRGGGTRRQKSRPQGFQSSLTQAARITAGRLRASSPRHRLQPFICLAPDIVEEIVVGSEGLRLAGPVLASKAARDIPSSQLARGGKQ
jgi:hypothetical protein